MFKKFLAFAAAGLFSLSASAGYVQYNFSYGAPNSGLSGLYVLNDADWSIAYMNLYLSDPKGNYGMAVYPHNNEGCVCLTGATTYFRNNGPTNFTIKDEFGADHITNLSVNFSRGTQGNFNYTVNYTANLYSNVPREIRTGTVIGLARVGALNPSILSELNMYGGQQSGLPRIVPTFIQPGNVPEPASIVLMGLGAFGAFVARRKIR